MTDCIAPHPGYAAVARARLSPSPLTIVLAGYALLATLRAHGHATPDRVAAIRRTIAQAALGAHAP